MVASYKYLGHYITNDLSDDRQRRTLFVQGNIMQGKFSICLFFQLVSVKPLKYASEASLNIANCHVLEVHTRT